MKTTTNAVSIKQPKIVMGSGIAPPRILKHIKAQAQSPKVTMGSGFIPPRILKHIKTHAIGTEVEK